MSFTLQKYCQLHTFKGHNTPAAAETSVLTALRAADAKKEFRNARIAMAVGIAALVVKVQAGPIGTLLHRSIDSIWNMRIKW